MNNHNEKNGKFNWRTEYEKIFKHTKGLEAKLGEYEDKIDELEEDVEDLEFKHSVLENASNKLYDRATKAEKEVEDLKNEIVGYQHLLSLIARNV